MRLFEIKNSSDETDGEEYGGDGRPDEITAHIGARYEQLPEAGVSLGGSVMKLLRRREAYERHMSLANYQIVMGYRGVRTHGKESCEHRPLSLFFSPALAYMMLVSRIKTN